MSTLTWDPTKHPRDRRDRWAEVGRWTGGFEQGWRGTFLGWDKPVVYVADRTIAATPDEWFDNGVRRPGVLWKAFLLPDDKLIMWFPGPRGPHHAEVEQRYRDDHPEMDPYEPYFEDSLQFIGVGIPRGSKDLDLVHDVLERRITPERLAALVRRIQAQRKDFELAESLMPQTYDEREFEIAWDPRLHPRDLRGRFRAKVLFDQALMDAADQIDQALGIVTQGLPIERARELTVRVAPHAPARFRAWAADFEHRAHIEPEEFTHHAKMFSELAKWVLDNLDLLASLLQGVAYEWNPRLHPRDKEGRWARKGASVIAPWKGIEMAKSAFPESEVSMENLTPDEQTKVRKTWERATGKSADTIASNLRDVLHAADPEVFADGESWYRERRAWIDERAKTHDLPVETVAAVVSALSPLKEWNENVRQADAMLQFRSQNREHFDAVDPRVSAVETISWAKRRGLKFSNPFTGSFEAAAKVLQGQDPAEVLPAAKTRSFYNSMVEPDNPFDVVIDSHMLNAAYGGMTPGPAGLLVEIGRKKGEPRWTEVVTPEGAPYIGRKAFGWFGSPSSRGQAIGVIPLLTDAVRQVTDEWNAEHPDEPLSPMQVQAIIWTQWLKMHPSGEKKQATQAVRRATVEAALAQGIA